MTIYILWYTNFQSEDEFHSAHSTEEKAQARIDRYGPNDRACFRIAPYNLDEE